MRKLSGMTMTSWFYISELLEICLKKLPYYWPRFWNSKLNFFWSNCILLKRKTIGSRNIIINCFLNKISETMNLSLTGFWKEYLDTSLYEITRWISQRIKKCDSIFKKKHSRPTANIPITLSRALFDAIQLLFEKFFFVQ